MTRGEVITSIYALFNAPHNADINIVGLNKVLDDLVSAEREACANVCINIAHKWTRMGAWGTNNEYHECAKAIRARGTK